MITLKVEEYCHNCEDFSPDIERTYGDNGVIETRVYCLLARRCRRLRDRHEKQEKAEFACRVCFEKLKKDNPQAIDCAWRGLDNEYCPELKKILEREDTKK